MADPETPTGAAAARQAEWEVIIPEVMDADTISRETMLARRLAASTKLLPQVASYLQDPVKGMEMIGKYRELIQTLRASGIRVTYASDWVLNVIKNEGRLISTGFLQDIGCERVAQIWGISRVSTLKGPTRDTLEDNSFIVRCEGDFFCESTGVYLPQVRGSRWTGEEFFKRLAKRQGGILNPLKVEEAALRNMHGRAVRALAGLSAVPEALLKECGVDTDKCIIVKWVGAREPEAGAPEEEATRGATARQELAQLVRDRAKAAGKNTAAFLRDLCKQQGLAEKDEISQLTESQAADLLVVLREAK